MMSGWSLPCSGLQDWSESPGTGKSGEAQSLQTRGYSGETQSLRTNRRLIRRY
jgi:hypothetical protein